MESTIQQKLQRILDQDYEFRLGDYIGQGFSLFQKQVGLFMGFTFVFFLIVMLANFVPIVGPIAVNLFLTPPLICGFYLVSDKIRRGESVVFNDFFKGFDSLGQLALAALVMGIIYMISLVPVFAVVGFSLFMGDFSSLNHFPFWAILLLVPLFYLAIGYSWTNMFIVFYKMEFWPAMEMSRKMITKHWGIIFLFSIVVGLLAGAGIIALGIGILATLPIALAASYSAFADVTRLAEAESADEIVDHLVD